MTGQTPWLASCALCIEYVTGRQSEVWIQKLRSVYSWWSDSDVAVDAWQQTSTDGGADHVESPAGRRRDDNHVHRAPQLMHIHCAVLLLPYGPSPSRSLYPLNSTSKFCPTTETTTLLSGWTELAGGI